MPTRAPKGNVRQGDGRGAGMGFRGGKGTPGYPVPPEMAGTDGVSQDELTELIVGVTKKTLGLGKKDEPKGVVKKADPLDLVVRAVLDGVVAEEKKGEDLGFGFNEDGFPLQDQYEFQDMPIAVENKKGSTRKWYDEGGKEKGSTKMKSDYGYVEGCVGADGEPVDVYVGKDEDADMVYVVHQNKAPDFVDYDEDKVMLGFPSEEAAREAYLRQYNSPHFYGGMSSMPVEKFRAKLKAGGKITNERKARARDFLDEVVARRAKKNPEFTRMVAEAETKASTSRQLKPSPKSIAHLEDLPPEQFLAFLGKMTGEDVGEIEVTEKIDGSAKITFRRNGPEVSVQSKNSPVRNNPKEWPDQPMYAAIKQAHHALQRGINELPDGVDCSADVLYTPVPNTIEYGSNAVVVHSGNVEKADLGDGWTLENVPTVDAKGVGSSVVREYSSLKDLYERLKVLEPNKLRAAGKGPYKAALETFKNAQLAVKKKLLPLVQNKKSAFGPEGGEIEGLVIKDIGTGVMTKLVDREGFTKLNRFLWKFREMLNTGVKVGDEWKPGVKTNFSAALCDAVGMPGLRAPNVSERIVEAGGLVAYVKKHTDADGKPVAEAFRDAVAKMGQELTKLNMEWEREKAKPSSVKIGGKERTYHPLHVERTDAAFDRAFEVFGKMGEMSNKMPKMEPLEQAVAVAMVVLGPNKLEKIGPVKEGKLNEVKRPDDFLKLAMHWREKLEKRGVTLTGEILGDGSYGVALEIMYKGRPAVMKVTGDETEARAMNHIKGKKLKTVVHVYDVFQFPEDKEWKPLYAVVQEKLKKPNRMDLEEWLDMIEILDVAKAGDGAISGRFDIVMQAVEKMQKPAVTKSFLELAEYFDFKDMIEELAKQNIEFMDYNAGNIMLRGDQWVLIDLGMSRSPGGDPPVLERIIEMVSEGRADKVGVTIGRFQPFHKGHAAMVRELARRFDRVLVLVAGNGKDRKKNPFSFDLRLEMMKRSLPDCFSKLEVHKAEVDGKPTGYIPGILSSISVNKNSTVDMETAVTVVVGRDRKADVDEQFRRAREHETKELYFDPSLAAVEVFPDVPGEAGRVSGTQVRDAVFKGDEEAVKKSVDPHLVSNPTEFEKVYQDMRKELGVKEEKLVDESIAEAGGVDALMSVLTSNEEKLAARAVHPIDISKLKALGQGTDGVAFDMGGNLVFKLTSDDGEAVSSFKVMKNGGSLKHVAKVYDVFQFREKGNARGNVYGCVQEKLKALSPNEAEEFDDATDWIIGSAKTKGGTDVTDIPPEVKTVVRPLVRQGQWKQAMEKLGEILLLDTKKEMGIDPADPNHPRAAWGLQVSQKRYVKLKDSFEKFKVPDICRELKSINVEFSDYHSGNLMKRGADYVITDLGRSETQGAKPPFLEGVDKVVSEVVAGAFTGIGHVPSATAQSSVKMDPDERWEDKVGLPRTRAFDDPPEDGDPKSVKNAGIDEMITETAVELFRHLRKAKRVLEVLPVDEDADRRVEALMARQPKSGLRRPIKKKK